MRAILTRTSRKLSRTRALNQEVSRSSSGTMENATSASRQSSQNRTPDDAREEQDVAEDRHDAGREELVQGVHVGGHPGDQPADGVAVVEGDGQALQVAEDLPAQVVHDVLPHELHHVALGVEHEEREHQGHQVDHRHDRQPLGGHGGRDRSPAPARHSRPSAHRRAAGPAPRPDG